MNTLILRQAKLKSIALPAEHGGWGFLLEPILVGLLLVPSLNGFLLALAMFATFLIHQPIKIAIKDYAKRRCTERTRWAERFALLYGGLALFFILLALGRAGTAFLMPLFLTLPLVGIQVFYDLKNQSRELGAELAGGVALGAIAPAIAILGEYDKAMILWLLLALRTIPSILYVRARLRLERGKPSSISEAVMSHVLAFLLGLGLVIIGQAHLLMFIALGILLLRCAWGLSRYRTPTSRPAIIGIQEMFYGFAFALLLGGGG
jgi:hypothetical protein